MKGAIGICFIVVGCLITAGGIAGTVDITYSAQYLNGDSWQYTYTVTNNGIPQGVQAFTIWFDDILYDNLAITSLSSITASWNDIVVQPDHVLGDKGYYDAVETNGPIALGQSIAGFSVTFDWLGQGAPGGEYFEVFDPDDYTTPIASGTTIPEPATVALLVLGGLVLRRRRTKH